MLVISTSSCRAMQSLIRRWRPRAPCCAAPSASTVTLQPPTTSSPSCTHSQARPSDRAWGASVRVIDVQAHVVPRVYLERLVDRSGYPRAERAGDKWWLCSGPAPRAPVSPAMADMDVRLRDMDAAGVDVQLLSTTLPGVEMFADPSFGVELARSANDDLAALVHASPDRFLGMAALPLQAPAAARDELRRATQELGFPAGCIYTNVGGRMLDDLGLELHALFSTAETLDVPLFLHPTYPVVAPHVQDNNLIPIIGFMLD